MSSLIFQAIDWQTKTVRDKSDPEITKTEIYVFGKTKDKEDVYLEITDFIFSFYVKLGQDKRDSDIKRIKESIEYYLSLPINNTESTFNEYIESKLTNLKDFYYFNGEQKQKFIKFESNNYYILSQFARLLSDRKQKPREILDLSNTYNKGKDALIQFFHKQNIKPSGWVEVKDYELITDDKPTYSKYNIRSIYSNVLHYESDDIVKFKLCAYDIECLSEDGTFPLASRKTDKIVSIAATISELGDNNMIYKCIIILSDNDKKKCPNIDNVDVFNCKTEKDLILKFCDVIQKQNPDFITGWNNFGFDDKYINDRATLLKINNKINFSRYKIHRNKFIKDKKLSSGALGDNILNFYDMPGRVNFDLMKTIQRDNRLVSYKLDFVVSKFFREQIVKIENQDKLSILTIKNKSSIFHKGQYVFILRTDCDTDYNYEYNKQIKFRIEDIKDNLITFKDFIDPEFLNEKGTKFICNAKDDLPPSQIFEKYKQGKPEDLKKLSLYNIQDCELCNLLCNKMFILINNIAMANTCYTTSFNIFNRGQGVRVYSIVSKKCLELGYVIPDLKRDTDNNQTFEGACVIPPTPGIKPAIFCLDYAALYPRSIICRNISHEMYLKDATDDNIDEYKAKYPNYTFNRIEYNIVTEKKKPKTKTEMTYEYVKENYGFNDIEKMINNETNKEFEETKKTKICYFAVNKDISKVGIIPQVVKDVLESRANVRKEQKRFEPHSFNWEIFEQKQLSYKVVCNSIYGALGASTGKIGLMELAACTTATGQIMLKTAKKFAEVILPKIIHLAFDNYDKYYKYIFKLFKSSSEDHRCEANKYFVSEDLTDLNKHFKSVYENIITTLKNYNFNLKVEYGDTDSIFVSANLTRKDTKESVYGLELRDLHIKIGKIAESIINELLPYPENLEYEKILSPFIILSKKRYVGNLYESDPKKFFQKNMGLVLKRRDNAPIVKYIYGGMVDKLLNTEDQQRGKREGLAFVEKSLNDMIEGKFKINYFTISKSLKSEYKNPDQIAHYVLAKRIALRDPGNAPKSGDRIDYVYIKVDNLKVKLQGDRIETPEYIMKNDLQIDYKFYITNQLKEPCLQIMNLFYKKANILFNNIIKKCDLLQQGYIMNDITKLL